MARSLLLSDSRGYFQRGLNGVTFHRFQDLGCDSTVGLEPAEGDAPVCAVIDMGSAAVVARHLTVRTTVSYVQHPATAAAPQQARQQTTAAPRPALGPMRDFICAFRASID